MKRYTLHVTRQNGFVVLTTVIILSAVLILIAQALSTSGYFQRRGLLDFQFKELSYWMARSCADRALSKLSNDLDYAGNETLTIDQYQCTIQPITTQSGNTIIKTNATVDQSATKLKVTTDGDLNVISFAEE